MTVSITTLRHKKFAILGLEPPPVPLKPYLYAFGNFEFGAGTRFIVESFKGIIGNSASSGGFRNEGGHGNVPGLQTINPKTLTLRIRVDAAYGEDGQGVIDTLTEAFRQPMRQLNTWVGDYDNRGYFMDGGATQLRIMRPGWTEPRVIYCRVIDTSCDSNYDTSMGNITFDVQFGVDDPLYYGYDTKIISMEPGDEFEWNQAGNHYDGYPPYIILTGTLRNPSVTRRYTNFFTSPDGNQLTVGFRIRGVTDMRIDMRNRMVDPMGAALVMTDQKFWTVTPTGTDVLFRQWISFNNEDDNAQAQFYIREVWAQ